MLDFSEDLTVGDVQACKTDCPGLPRQSVLSYPDLSAGLSRQ